MVNLINKDSQSRQLTKKVSQFVCLTILVIATFLKEACLPLFLLNPIQNHLLSIGHRHKAEQLGQRLMVGNLLNIGILGLVGLISGLALIQYLEGNLPFQRRCCRLRDYPGGIELLDGLQAGNHRRFQTRRSKHDEVVGEGWVVRLLTGKIQIQINERSHQICFTSTHGETEEIIGVGYTVESISEYLIIINAFRGFLDLLFKLGRYLLTSFVGQECVL